MMENTHLWDTLGKTDPKHTKKFKRAGGFEGTAIKPMFSYRRLTEEFGPCGKGWGVDEPQFQVVPGHNSEVLVFCTVSGWYMLDDKRCAVYGVGGDKVVTHIKANEKYSRPERWENDDEAFKKAFTDALTNAFKLVGVGADVHMGMFDDNKYVNSMEQEFAEAAKPKSASAAEQKRGLGEIERELIDCRTPGDVKKLLNSWADDAEKAGWSADYWNEARRRFAKRKAELEKPEDDFPGDTGTGVRNPAGRELSNAEAF
jgi:hypothetical protein